MGTSRKNSVEQNIATLASPSEADYIKSFDASDSKDENIPVVVFALDGLEYAIEVSAAEEVVRPKSAAALPHMPGFVRGVASMRGEMVVLLDLKMRLGLAESVSPYERIVVVEQGDLKAGLTVDRLCGILELSPKDVVAASENEGNAYYNNFCKGVYKTGNRRLVLLDTQKLLDFAPLPRGV